MHTQNRIDDGFWKITQDTETKLISIYKSNQLLYTIAEEEMISLEDLHKLLITKRANYFIGGI